MKQKILLQVCLFFFFQCSGQSRYLSDIIITDFDKKYGDGYAGISFNYWRYDTCLYSKQMCKYNTSTAASVKVVNSKNVVTYEFLRRNVNGYPGHNQYDTFTYKFVSQDIQNFNLTRKLLIKDKYKVDTFSLLPIDTLFFRNSSLLKKVFGDQEIGALKSLKVYVLKSVDEFGSTMLHYWVERIGIIKLTDEKCWRYSCEMNDKRTSPIKKMFIELVKIIKKKYKDPYWISNPCGVE